MCHNFIFYPNALIQCDILSWGNLIELKYNSPKRYEDLDKGIIEQKHYFSNLYCSPPEKKKHSVSFSDVFDNKSQQDILKIKEMKRDGVGAKTR